MTYQPTDQNNDGIVDSDINNEHTKSDQFEVDYSTEYPSSPRQADSYGFPALAAHPNVSNPIFTRGDFTLSNGVAVETVADPFIVRDGGVFYLFFEAMEAGTPDQNIHYATSTDGGNWTHQGEVLNVAGSLSYPQVFKEGGTWWMLPQNGSSGATTDVYRGDPFPATWTLETTISIMSVASRDTTFFKYDDLYWLFWQDEDGTGANTVRLAYTDSWPNGTWTIHPSSPIRPAGHIDRPGGRPIVHDDHIDIFMQAEVDGVYGAELRGYRISELTTTTYSDTVLSGSPILQGTGHSPQWNGIRMHHADFILNDRGNISFGVVDGGTGSGEWSLGIVSPTDQIPVAGKFSLPANQTVAAGATDVEVQMGDPNMDSHNALNTTTYRWKCPRSGYYRVGAQFGVRWNPTADARVTLDWMNRTTADRLARTNTIGNASEVYQSLSLTDRIVHMTEGSEYGMNVTNTAADTIEILSGDDQSEVIIERVNML